jgi:hypothetical protein
MHEFGIAVACLTLFQRFPARISTETPSIFNKVLRGFVGPLEANAEIVPQLRPSKSCYSSSFVYHPIIRYHSQ